MQMTIETFNDRVTEIDLYFDTLKALYIEKSEVSEPKPYINDDFLKILKSNALIMIYNLVESSIMGGILEIYDALKHQGLAYKQVSDELKQIWFEYKFNQVYDKNAHYNSYRSKAQEIINNILDNEILILDRKATDISGNLDADKIRQICMQHGITFRTAPDCRGGVVLSDVKEKRNDLAHGTVSFVECGRDYSVEGLEQIKKETVSFLRGILSGFEDYYNDRLYLCAENS